MATIKKRIKDKGNMVVWGRTLLLIMLELRIVFHLYMTVIIAFKKIKIIKTEFSNNPTISYINQDNQEKQYAFYIMSQKGDIKVTIVIFKNNIIKILDDENHQVHYYQSQNINYEKLNIDHLPW